jgi:DNA polymerase I-like protein with 3'-5' exonuclease and polymerase domains
MFRELRDFKEIWFHDFEYQPVLGEHVIPHCLVAHELRSGKRLRLWRDQLLFPPYRMDRDCLFVSYNAAAELSCHLSLTWPLPRSILDLSAEFRCQTNGHVLPDGVGLLGAMSYFGLNSISVVDKEEMRDLAMRGGPYSEQERKDLIAYCETDVVALPKLLGRMWDKSNLPQALHRGRYMRALAITEFNGAPIDTDTLRLIRTNWQSIKLDLVADVDRKFGVYDDTTFKQDQFAALLLRLNIRNWPLTKTGKLSTSDKVFKKMADAYPVLQPLKELTYSMGKLRVEKLAVGPSCRNRTSFWAFGTKTSRNTPKASEYIFGPSAWIRSLIKPSKGFAVAYVDYSAQEFAVAAVLSGDRKMIEGYQTDPYLSFAISAGAAPATATKSSHPEIRSKYKLCTLGILYGMAAKALATYSGQTVEVAEKILQSHHRLYQRFWEWSDEVLERALLRGFVQTVYGWKFSAPWKSHKPNKKNRKGVPIRTIRNFPVQANAAEMFRLACCLIAERGVRLSCLVHDAVLVEARITDIDRVVSITRSAMAEASRDVLKGQLELRTDAQIFPDRYVDERGQAMWETVMRLTRKAQAARRATVNYGQLELSL